MSLIKVNTIQNANGTTALSIAANGAISVGTQSVSGNLSFNSGYGSAAVAYGCRAWVNFDGTGTPAIRGSGNVSSLTDNGTGDYTINFATAMPDANYAPVAIGEINGGAMSICVNQGLTAAAWNLRVRDNSGNNIDSSITTVAIFR